MVAHLRLPAAILGWAASSVVLALLAHSIARRLSPGQGRQRMLQWVFWWYFLVTLTVWGTGVVGALRPHRVAAVLLVAAGVLFYKDRRVALLAWRDVVWTVRTLFSATGRRPVVGGILLLIGVVVSLRQSLHVWVLPPWVSYDTLTYHLPKVADWIREGRLAVVPTPVVRSYWPANFELFQTWFALFWHHDAVIEAAGLVVYALAMGSVYGIVRSLGVSRAVAAIAATAYATTPALLLNAVSGKNDIAVTACFLFVVAVLLEWRHQRPRLHEMACVLVCALGIGVGAKPYLAVMLPGLVFLLPVLWPAFRKGVCRAGGLSGRAAVVLILAGTVLGSYWYGRNLYLFRNPVYPADLRLFGKRIAGDGSGSAWQQGSFSGKSLKSSISDIAARRVFDREGPYTPDLINMTGWGWFAFCAGLPAVLIQSFRRRYCLCLLLTFLAAAALLLAFVAFDPWNMRFLQWVPAVMAVAWALLVEDFQDWAVRQAALWFAVMCVAMNVIATIGNGMITPETWREFRRRPVADRVAYSCFGALRKSVPAGETLAYFMESNDPVYLLSAPDMARRVRWLRLEGPDDSFHAAMLRKGHKYLAINADDSNTGPLYRQFRMELRKGLFKSLGSECYEVAK
jgi:hypothetical protein